MSTAVICFLYFMFSFSVIHLFAEEHISTSTEERLMKKILSLEVKMGIMEKELCEKDKIIKEVVSKEIVEIKTVLDQMQEKIQRLSGQTGSEKGHTKYDGNETLYLIAFSANNVANNRLSTGQTLVFPNVSLNEGGGYNSSTGVFTSPESGLYQFSFHTCNSNEKHVAIAIVHEGSSIANTVQYHQSERSCGSVNAIRLIRAGEKVWVKCTHPTYISIDGHRSTTFMGLLIRKI